MDRVMDYWPSFYRDILDFVELAKTESVELEQGDEAVERLFHDQFVESSSEAAVKRREQMLKIQADSRSESLEFRKRRILNRYQTKPPFTIRYLQQQLDFLVGEGRTVASVDVNRFVLTVTANIDDANVFREVERTIRTVKPANMLYQQNTGIDDCIRLEERITKCELIWTTRLGTAWRLGVVPFAELGPEEVVK